MNALIIIGVIILGIFLFYKLIFSTAVWYWQDKDGNWHEGRKP